MIMSRVVDETCATPPRVGKHHVGGLPDQRGTGRE
jgi:hypothetical protein